MSLLSSPHNPYIAQMYGEYAPWVFDENIKENKGLWRENVFASSSEVALDLEIGTGNGTHFAHRAKVEPDRMLVGLELKYKTLVQSIRRALHEDSQNMRMARFQAENILEAFAPGELNDVFIFFPDPWPKRRQQKNRLIQKKFVEDLFVAMKSGSYLNFKTDDYSYFLQASRVFAESAFEMVFYTEDLHQSFRARDNFVTQFEAVFLKKGQSIYACRMYRP